jgi:prepilin-type N-terminal cleavage/methylation domain-containing protein
MKITSARITNLPQQMFGPSPEVIATLEDGTEEKLFEYYSDEISFSPSEFVGLTAEEGRRLKFKKDKQFLQGFTLIELIVVIAVLVTVIAVIVNVGAWIFG